MGLLGSSHGPDTQADDFPGVLCHVKAGYRLISDHSFWVVQKQDGEHRWHDVAYYKSKLTLLDCWKPDNAQAREVIKRLPARHP